MRTILIDSAEVRIDDEDAVDVGRHTWHLRAGKPRACIYLQQVTSSGLIQGNTYMRRHQIPLERFVYKLTAHTNIRIRHLFGDEFNCARSTMRLEKKDTKLSSLYRGVIKRGDYYYARVGDGTVELGPFVLELEAARAHDIEAIELMGWRAKTNFYSQL